MRSRADTSASHVLPAAVLLAIAVVIGYAESVLLPPLPVPGIRLGLANVAVIVALATIGVSAAVTVSIGRVVLVALATGTLGGPVFALSLAGAFASLLAMESLRRAGGRFSVVGWSVAGSAAHVTAQVAVCAVIIESAAVLALLPVALGVSIPLGLGIGHAASLLVSRVGGMSVTVAGRQEGVAHWRQESSDRV
ncbi:MAG TPA: Gx transporter family protein [Coriobacteriia bacterium]|nr:Gx transporter family protein [Coriobacteriia bacterium]